MIAHYSNVASDSELEQLIFQIITRDSDSMERQSLEYISTMLSWSIYGLTYRWNQEGRQESPSDLAERVVPFIMNGAGLLR
ncbi:TetR family transcriptional regulator C-terminal domain-containing protein [Paenibacillus sp. JNUCC31]|uniref:TetR-like C-terminal domain-containing protein n=1 Tax=Paenibacillus sp. JNUCC-31 TaxID=2777983 RepID=UPI00177B2B0A|nr:TetR-like C-terminal domain-containing protein [Paenibacillus sp. JNUCC-31]QOS82252.1 TetR family transcriptional regulator C-terminal domain-containing protein [Paenibacillus sp. JNUCC-31]